MLADKDDLPVVGQSKFQLGARVPTDIRPDAAKKVSPANKGMSVFIDELPHHLKPASILDGGYIVTDEVIMEFVTDILNLDTDELQTVHQGRNPGHAVVQPRKEMEINAYQAALAGTRPDWRTL
jgi:hypothetical protein